MTVENLPVPAAAAPINPEFLGSHQKFSAAAKDQATALQRQAIAIEAMAQVGEGGKEARFVEALKACIVGKVATDVEGFLTFARELCDGIDREFPSEPA